MSHEDNKAHLPLAEVRIMPQHGAKATVTPAGRTAIVKFLLEVIEKLDMKTCTGYSMNQPDKVYSLRLTRK